MLRLAARRVDGHGGICVAAPCQPPGRPWAQPTPPPHHSPHSQRAFGVGGTGWPTPDRGLGKSSRGGVGRSPLNYCFAFVKIPLAKYLFENLSSIANCGEPSGCKRIVFRRAHPPHPPCKRTKLHTLSHHKTTTQKPNNQKRNQITKTTKRVPKGKTKETHKLSFSDLGCHV